VDEIWLEALDYTDTNTNTENLTIENLFSISQFNSHSQTDLKMDFSSSRNLIENTERENDENKWPKGSISIKNFFEMSSSILLASNTVSYLPKNIILDHDYQKIHDSFLIGRIFNDLWLTSNNVINHWSSYVSNGKVKKFRFKCFKFSQWNDGRIRANFTG